MKIHWDRSAVDQNGNHIQTRQHPRFPLRMPVLCGDPAVPDPRAALEEQDVLHGLRFLWDDVDKELFLISALLRQVLDSDEAFAEGIKEDEQ